jgi:hypothetical protein
MEEALAAKHTARNRQDHGSRGTRERNPKERFFYVCKSYPFFRQQSSSSKYNGSSDAFLSTTAVTKPA